MCGIAGIIYKNRNVETAELEKMTEKIKHRGPDSDGFYVENNVGFGHRRLAIIDVSHSADQPFSSSNSVLVFNGAIYNYLEIREELQRFGYRFKTNSDTEVLLYAYELWGENCVKKFNGMWAFAIHDRKKNILFCSRDRFGVKPFYYHADSEGFYFASEIKAILEVKKLKKINLQIVLQFLDTNFTEHNNETFFKEIFKLQGSHNLVYDLSDHSYQIKKYYDLVQNKKITKLNLQQSINLFEKEFERSIKLRLRADVKVGSALSGGLDSSYTVSVVSKLLESKSSEFTAVTVGCINKEDDEADLSKTITNITSVNHKVIYPTKQEFENAIQQVIYSMEEPFTGLSVYMQTFLMKEAKKNGIKVLLDGQGADEILLGYSRYAAAFMRSHSFKESFLFFLNIRRHYGISKLEALKIYFYFTNYHVRKLYLMFRGSNLKEKYKRKIDYRHIKKLNKSYSNIFELQKNEIFWAQIPQLLRWEDMNSMAYSIETRLPFLDYKFVETFLSINNNFKIYEGWSKYILRNCVEKFLPREIAWKRKKIGFNAPIEEWWPPSKEITDTINNSKIIQELFKNKFTCIHDRDFEWRLYNLAIWEKLYGMEL